MKKLVFALVVLAVVMAAAFNTGTVAAQGNGPAVPQSPGAGRMAGRGAGGNGSAAQDGILHDGMIAVYAQAMDLSVEDLNARLAAGETLAQIAAAQGLTVDEFWALKADARAKAVEQAVKDGTLTQAQADWMAQRGRRMGGGARGGQGQRGGNAGSGDCPYYPQTNP